ncbi:hypothetical protein EYR40_002692 [Pleurotus pulmonarius]|nr:hypothetical protein EYR40_002692 [Pleurotus pulmonarius]KAF4582451.1 hypothetical protein EYR38_002576 [Pleurotus pulmonarius]
MSGTFSTLGEAAFTALPKTLQAKIDAAFTSISHSHPPLPQTRSPFADTEAGGGGGFLVEDAVIDDVQISTVASARIPLASIPAALEALDLPPNDRQILAVFRDAAESDHEDGAGGDGAAGDGAAGELTVSRGQWRAVCAVLLEGASPSPSPSSPSSPSPSPPPRELEERTTATRPRRSKAAYTPVAASNRADADADADDSGDDSEPYVASDDSDHDHDMEPKRGRFDDDDDDDGDSDDEYTGHPASKHSKHSKSSKATKAIKSNIKSPKKAFRKLSALPDSQASLDAFALFFPSLPRDSEELKARKIMLTDLQAAMKSAGEKCKADELKEMLDLFSTSPDKSISFADFGNIMDATGLA